MMKTIKAIVITLLTAVFMHAGTGKVSALSDRLKADHKCLVETDREGVYEVLDYTLEYYGNGYMRSLAGEKVYGQYEGEDNNYTLVVGDTTLTLTQTAKGIYAGTMKNKADGSERRVIEPLLHIGYNPDRSGFIQNLTSGNYRMAYIQFTGTDGSTDRKKLAVPVTVTFTPVTSVCTEYDICGVLSLTSDHPMIQSLGNLEFPYHFKNQYLYLVASNGNYNDIYLETIRYGSAAMQLDAYELPDIGKVGATVWVCY